MHLLVGLHDVAEVSLGHLPSVDPEAGSVEGDLDLLHVLDPELALLHLLQRQVEGALVQQDGAAGAAHVVPAALGVRAVNEISRNIHNIRRKFLLSPLLSRSFSLLKAPSIPYFQG